MVTRVELFKKKMEPSEKMYTKELGNFAKKYDALGKMTLEERPDIDTLDYIYSFEVLNGTSQEELDLIHDELHSHMEKFSKEKGIRDFYINTLIYL